MCDRLNRGSCGSTKGTSDKGPWFALPLSRGLIKTIIISIGLQGTAEVELMHRSFSTYTMIKYRGFPSCPECLLCVVPLSFGDHNLRESWSCLSQEEVVQKRSGD